MTGPWQLQKPDGIAYETMQLAINHITLLARSDVLLDVFPMFTSQGIDCLRVSSDDILYATKATDSVRKKFKAYGLLLTGSSAPGDV